MLFLAAVSRDPPRRGRAPVHGGRPRMGEGGRGWVRVGADGRGWLTVGANGCSWAPASTDGGHWATERDGAWLCYSERLV